LLRTAVEFEESDEIVRGRILDSKVSSFESSHKASRVNIRSSNSSVSASDFTTGDEDEDEDEDDDSAICFALCFSFVTSQGLHKNKPKDREIAVLSLLCDG
jgi:hypothetical protein